MTKFEVRSTGYALMEQVVVVEAEDAEEAENMVRSDEFDTYHGNQEWQYRGIKDTSIEVTVSAI
jgi:hypothetical protein